MPQMGKPLLFGPIFPGKSDVDDFPFSPRGKSFRRRDCPGVQENPKPDVQLSKHPAFQLILNFLSIPSEFSVYDNIHTRSVRCQAYSPAQNWQIDARVEYDRHAMSPKQPNSRNCGIDARLVPTPLASSPFALGDVYPSIGGLLPICGPPGTLLCPARNPLASERRFYSIRFPWFP